MFDGFIKNQLNHKLSPYGLSVTHYASGKLTIQVVDLPDRLAKIENLVTKLQQDENVYAIALNQTTGNIEVAFNPSITTNLSALNQWLQIIEQQLG